MQHTDIPRCYPCGFITASEVTPVFCKRVLCGTGIYFLSSLPFNEQCPICFDKLESKDNETSVLECNHEASDEGCGEERGRGGVAAAVCGGELDGVCT